MSLAEVRSSPSSPTPDACQCDVLDAGASVTSDLHKYQVACTCKPASVQYASADDPGPPPPAKTDTPPALPPRPPTSVLAATNRRNNSSVGCSNEPQCRRRKYAWWCCGCGALAAALGGLLAAQHILLRAYTASPHHLETVPAAVPAAMLVLTGVCIMSLARRRNRYSYMIKVVGACCLVCALTCVLVTITTTVIHMNKLQTLKFCEYTKLTRTCTCFSMSPDNHHGASDDEGVRCVFEGVSDCGVVHGALYWCLRGVFALSVSAVLVCIFSCMLAYQLLSHERKKMYWEQLELRCRSLYRAPGGSRGGADNTRTQNTCSCCTQCNTTQPAWDFSLQHRFWAPGRIGNLYSPNPGTGRKTSPWSWFPWPRGNTQNARCQMTGVPQSGDSAYGFCENEPNPNPSQQYDDTYPQNFDQFQRQAANFGQNQPNFSQNTSNFSQNTATFSQNPANFAQSSFQYQEGFEGVSEGQPGVWGPPPPYSPHGRSASRHHLHQDPASATLLHHHHIDHRNPANVLEVHSCARNYLHNMQNIDIHRIQDMNVNPDMRLNPDLTRMNPELARMNPDLARINPELARINPELARVNTELVRMNPELARMNPELGRINPELVRMNPELARLNPDLNVYPNEQSDLCMQEMMNAAQGFNTLRGHLVPYRNCQRVGMSAGNLHREDVNIECLHQKSGSKVSEQSGDSCPKQGKENLGFQNDKHSPIRCSLQESRPSAESEVYFADVSSCCNVSVKADCCINPNVSALVGTIENHQESSESDTSFTLTRQQRPQPQASNKRRPRHADKHKHRHDYNLQHVEHLPPRDCRMERMSDARMSERFGDRMGDLIERNERIERMCGNEHTVERLSGSRDRLNESRSDRMSDRLNDSRIERMSMRGTDPRLDRDRSNDPRVDRMNDSRIERFPDSRFDRSDRDRLSEARLDRLNDSRAISDRVNDSRLDRSDLDRSNDSRIERLSDRANDPRLDRSDRERPNESRIDRLNDSRLDRSDRERPNESRIDRLNDSRLDRSDRERSNESRIDRLNDSRLDRSDRERPNESRIDRLNDSRLDRSDRDRSNESRIDRLNDSRLDRSDRERPNESRIDRLNDSRLDRTGDRGNDCRSDSRIDRLNDSRTERMDRFDGRMSDMNASMRNESSPKICSHVSPLRLLRTSPKTVVRDTKSDSKEFFTPISPLSPNTEESLLSDEERPETVYSNEPEASKCLGPDSQYEPVKNEVLKTNHHHCYSDTNTMDSGWQSGSEKQVTD